MIPPWLKNNGNDALWSMGFILTSIALVVALSKIKRFKQFSIWLYHRFFSTVEWQTQVDVKGNPIVIDDKVAVKKIYLTRDIKRTRQTQEDIRPLFKENREEWSNQLDAFREENNKQHSEVTIHLAILDTDVAELKTNMKEVLRRLPAVESVTQGGELINTMKEILRRMPESS